MTLVLLGHVEIDSAAFACGDPIYLDSLSGPLSFVPGYILEGRKFAEVDGCVTCWAGYGDGNYPVYGEFGDDGVIQRLIVDFSVSDDD